MFKGGHAAPFDAADGEEIHPERLCLRLLTGFPLPFPDEIQSTLSGLRTDFSVEGAWKHIVVLHVCLFGVELSTETFPCPLDGLKSYWAKDYER